MEPEQQINNIGMSDQQDNFSQEGEEPVEWSDEELRQFVLVGIADIEAGRYTTYDEAGLQEFFDNIKHKSKSKIKS
jgi:hypothetical protein